MQRLPQLRQDRDAWASVACLVCSSEDRGEYDGNARSRHQALLELQYDCQPSDVELVRYLFEQEIEAAATNSFQGCGDSLTLSALLLARFRDPADVALFAQAKLANFDTACGFPLQFMWIVGGEDAPQMLKKSHPELWEPLFADNDEAAVPPAELAEWWESINRDYPQAERDETLPARYERALAFDDLERARELLDQRVEQTLDASERIRIAKYEYARLGDYREAARYAELEAEASDPGWDLASALRDVVSLRRQAGDFDRAQHAAQRLDGALDAFDDWIGLGLGRMAIHEVFELAVAHPDLRAALQVFQLADKWYGRSHDLAMVGLQSAVAAAQRCGVAEKAHEYQALAEAEQKRIDEMLREMS